MAEVRLVRGQSPAANNITIGNLVLVFSYETCVAYHSPSEGWVVSENVWSKTTGKHINQEVPQGAPRISHDEFTARLREAMKRIEVSA